MNAAAPSEDTVVLEQTDKAVELTVETTPVRIVVTEIQGSKRVWLPLEFRKELYMLDDDVAELWGNSNVLNHIMSTDEVRGITDLAVLKARRTSYSIPLVRLFLFKEDIEWIVSNSDSDSNTADATFLLELIEFGQKNIAEKFLEGSTAAVDSFEVTERLNTPGLFYTYTLHGQRILFKTKGCQYRESMFGNFLSVSAVIVVDDGTSGLSFTDISLRISEWGGKKTLAEVGLKEVTLDHEDTAYFVARGKRYVDITTKPAYVKFEGAGVRRSWRGNVYFKADGRIMIDMTAMRETDPNYDDYVGIDPHQGRGRVRQGLTNPTNEVYALCSPFVYGFSFSAKRWGEFLLDQITDIQFRDDAYDKLVMEEEQKQMIFALVDQVSTGRSDVIDGKSGGTILLLAGPPGVGKTLTAETIAERLRRPLYMVGIGELGTNPGDLETNLTSVLNIAQSWNAVLLIDEADIFMEERSSMDVERNAMVGIFLRLLEYYAGVLFLTTNRANNLDQAFFSRISMSLFYDKLTDGDRKKIWKNFGKMNDFQFSEMDYDILSQNDINGREIKNVVKLASALALRDKQPLSRDYMLKVIQKGQHFKDSVNVKKTFWGNIRNRFTKMFS